MENNSETIVKKSRFSNFQIYVSYCWPDRENCRNLASNLNRLGINVLFDDDKLSIDSFIAIEKCDLVLMCLSQSYLKCSSCQKEAKFIFEKRAPFLPISLDQLTSIAKYLVQLIAGKNYEKLMNSDLEYPANKNKLKKRIFNFYYKLANSRNRLIPSKKVKPEKIIKLRSQYDENLKLCIEKEKTIVNKERKHIEDIFQNENLIEYPWINRWYLKYPNVTWSNIREFTPTGYGNDAVFNICEETLDYLKSKLNKGKSIGCGGNLAHLTNKRQINLCQLSSEWDLILSKKNEGKEDESIIFYKNKIKREWRFKTALPKNGIAWRTIENKDFNLGEPREQDEINKRNFLDNDLARMEKKRNKLNSSFNINWPNTKFSLKMSKKMNNSRMMRERRWIGASIRRTATKIFRAKHRQKPEFHTGNLCFRNGGNIEELEQIYQTRPEIPSLMDLDFEGYQKLELPVDNFKPIMCKHARLPKKHKIPPLGPIRKVNFKDISTQVNFTDLKGNQDKLKTGDNFMKPRGIKSEAKTFKDSLEYEKNKYLEFGSDDQLFIDEDKISSEEESDKQRQSVNFAQISFCSIAQV
ncbi:unnamed protein product [Brachionus calyciflorus]|uniref:TIR domain-containing protein n=1 Tax=Brachionus calyciflorus TaxID=104777 RepID=A0A813WZB2_9BILA|nr:unnamed protein product [Brachionus calyciflorus]